MKIFKGTESRVIITLRKSHSRFRDTIRNEGSDRTVFLPTEHVFGLLLEKNLPPRTKLHDFKYYVWVE